MLKYLDFILPEPDRHGADKPNHKTDLTWETLQKYRNEVRISKKFNDYLKGKSVIIVGPSPYLKGKGRGEFIDSHDIVIRMNKGWKPDSSLHKDYGSKTNIRWHCMMEQMQNGGPFEIDSMVDYGVEWLASPFPRNLDYFHNDNIKFEIQNSEEKINFYCFSDLIYYINVMMALETRPNVGTVAFMDLMNYDIKNLHLCGITFLLDGYLNEYGRNPDFKRLTLGHATEPQAHLAKLFLENEPEKFSMDQEIINLIYQI